MYFSQEDLDLFDKLQFPQVPVAVALTIIKPEGIERLDDENSRVYGSGYEKKNTRIVKPTLQELEKHGINRL